MNWAVFGLALYLALAIERGLAGLLAIPDSVSGVSPSFVLILVTWVALQASSSTSLWAGLIAGLAVDLVAGADSGGLVGAHALGYALVAFAVLQMRGMVYRQSGLTLGVMTFLGGLFGHLAIVLVLSLRGMPLLPAEALAGWDTTDQLARRFAELIYTGVVASILPLVLSRTLVWWGFPTKR
ncbi:MAG: rod shape-determining protein MreD [Planctomycetota bacterium]